MKYRKKPVVIDAWPWELWPINGHWYPVDSDTNPPCSQCGNPWQDHRTVPTLEGFHSACPGDFLICGVQGEYYPCKPEIFEQTYEEVI